MMPMPTMRMVIHCRSGSDKTASVGARASSSSSVGIASTSIFSPPRSGTKDKARILNDDGSGTTVDLDDGGREQDDDNAEEPPPSSSPASEDDRQYMMLRHSDDDDDDDHGKQTSTHRNETSSEDANGAAEAGPTGDAAGEAGGNTTENSKLSIVSPVADSASAAAAIRRQRRQLAGAIAPPQPAPATVIRQVSHYPYHLPTPQPFPVSSPRRHPHEHYQDQQQLERYYDYYEGGGGQHHDVYYHEQQQYEAERDQEFSFPHQTSFHAAPSWGSSTNDSSILLTRRVGTFDYGDVNGMAAASAGASASPNNTAAILEEGPTTALGEGSAFSTSTSSSFATTNVITPAQIIRKSSLMVSQQPHQQQSSHYHNYLYPPSSPIRASPLGEQEQGGSLEEWTSEGRPSPKVEDEVNDDDDRCDAAQSSSSPSSRRMKNMSKDEEEEHMDSDHQESAQPLEEEEEELAAEWLPPRRGSGGDGSSSLAGDSAARRNFHSHDGTPRPSRPPPLPKADSLGAEEAPTTLGSPSSPPIPPGGRVQLVGGEYDDHQNRPQVVWRDNSWGGDDNPPPTPRQLESASPWSVVSRSRSAESHGSSGIGMGSSGGNSEWDPPRPTRHPMVPPPGRPNSIVVGDRRRPPPPRPSPHYGEPIHYPTTNAPFPPPPPSQYYAWGGRVDYYGGGGIGRDTRMMPPPPPPSIQKSSSSLSSTGVSAGGGATFSPPQRGGAGGRGQSDAPSTPSSSSLAYFPHPPSEAAGIKGGVSGYPTPPSYHPPTSYPPPPHLPSYLHPPPNQYYPHYPPQPPHHHHPHPPSHLQRVGAGPGPYHPYSQPHPSSQQATSWIAAKESPQDPTAHPLLRDYNPNQDSLIRPQFRNIKKAKTTNKTMMTAATSSSAVAAAVDNADGGNSNINNNESDGRDLPALADAASGEIGIRSENTIGGQSSSSTATGPPMRRRRRRNPTEKAALAARMAAAAAAALRERIAKRVEAFTSNADQAGSSQPTKKYRVEGSVIDNEIEVVDDEVGGDNDGGGGDGGTGAIGSTGVIPDEKSLFSEEELKTLGSGDDEDIPAARRAAMASALALRAAAGGSPVEPPKSASEVNFDIANPPTLPIVPPSTVPALSSASQMTENDVLCGRGGGTNSQTGNRRYRALVRDFQPTYLMAKRQEKPRMARSVVLIVRNRGGRFLRRDDTDGRLYEVGDEKAEAKTSQALREGLDVRATKTAANTLMSSCGSGRSGDGTVERSKKSGRVPNTNHAIIVKDGFKESRDRSTASRPSHPSPGYDLVAPHQAGSGGGGGIRPPYLGGYSDTYYRSRYPMCEYSGPPISHHPVTGSLPPPPNPAIHHHPYYFGGGAGDAVRGGYHYPAFAGYPRATYPPSPPRSSSSKAGGGDAKSLFRHNPF